MIEAIEEIIRIQEERNLAMKQLSENLGIDISFSEEEQAKFIQEAVEKYIEDKVLEGIVKWTKLA
jgi:predicted DNA-binding protein|tara:strand:+ start:762 stop:956 length:195 start_codon:yes stop_codon:yes gene_type:complete